MDDSEKSEKMEKMAAKLEELGIKKDQIDEKMVWGMRKMFMGAMKMRWSMKEHGMSDDEAVQKLNKIFAMIAEKDMIKWEEKMKDKMENGGGDWHGHHHHGCGCGSKGDWKKNKEETEE